jgi:hypothetical protein
MSDRRYPSKKGTPHPDAEPEFAHNLDRQLKLAAIADERRQMAEREKQAAATQPKKVRPKREYRPDRRSRPRTEGTGFHTA